MKLTWTNVLAGLALALTLVAGTGDALAGGVITHGRAGTGLEDSCELMAGMPEGLTAAEQELWALITAVLYGDEVDGTDENGNVLANNPMNAHRDGLSQLDHGDDESAVGSETVGCTSTGAESTSALAGLLAVFFLGRRGRSSRRYTRFTVR